MFDEKNKQTILNQKKKHKTNIF